MAPLPGIQGLTKPPNMTDEGILSAHAAPGTATTHSEYGDTAGQNWPAGYGAGIHGTSYGVDINNTGQRGEHGGPAGQLIDQTPDVHCAPYPETGPATMDHGTQADINEAATARMVQRHALHGRALGAEIFTNRFSPAGRETPTNFTTDRYESPNETMLATGTPGQLASAGTGGGASKDTTQGLGQLNPTDEFAHGHSIRRIQHDPMVWDRSLDYAPPQPLWGRYQLREARFDGPDSPYFEAGDTSTGQQVVWEGRIGNPTAYQPPAEPLINPPSPASAGEDSWAW